MCNSCGVAQGVTWTHVKGMFGVDKEWKCIELINHDKGMFGNFFFSLFSVFKNNFLFLRLKNLFGNPKWTENKNRF